MELFLQQVVNGVVLGGAYSLVALGLFLVFNALHVPNFAHGELFALGAYLQYTCVVGMGLPFFGSLPLVCGAAGLIGIVLERLVFRRLERFNTVAVLVATLALAIVIQELIAKVWGQDYIAVPNPLSAVVEIGGIRVSAYRLVIVTVVLAVAAAVAVAVYRSTYGRSLRAVAQNREIAELTGIDVRRVTIATFALSAGLAGLAGALLAPTVSLNAHMGFHPTLVAFAILVVIGAGARTSAVLVASFAVAIGETLVAGYVSNTARTAVVFVVLVLFLAWRPDGVRRQPSEAKAML